MNKKKQKPVQKAEQNHQNNPHKVVLTQSVLRSSPLPPPEEMQGYKDIDPSFPDRIITMAEKEQRFRHISTFLGQSGMIIVITIAFLVGGYLAIQDKTIPAVTLFGVVGYLVYVIKSKEPKPPAK